MQYHDFATDYSIDDFYTDEYRSMNETENETATQPSVAGGVDIAISHIPLQNEMNDNTIIDHVSESG